MNEQQLQGLADHLNQSRAEFVTAMKMVRDILKALNENIVDFRGFLAAKVECVQETFDDEYLASAARLVQAQEKFTESALAVNDVTVFLNNRVQHYDDIFSAQLDMMGKHNESAKTILEMCHTFFTAFAQTNANVEANSKKLDAFILKMESYFGSGKGLEYDN
jgi:outer membrane PBP1 activator LpoA protein